MIKELSPSTIIILGGAGISAYPEFFLKNLAVDYTVSGEAEVNIRDVIDFLKHPELQPQAFSGLGWKVNGTCNFSPVQKFTVGDQIQSPVVKTFESAESIFLTVSVSRGCPLSCNFCSNWLCHGKAFRRISLERLQAEIETFYQSSLAGSGKTVRINFEDDNLLFDYEFWLEAMRLFREYFPGSLFFAENGIDYRLLDKNKCSELISSGFAQFNFSLGSTDISVLESADRKVNLDRYDECLSVAQAHNIPVITYVICGFKDDSIESISRNLAFLAKRETLIGLSLYYAVPGINGFENRSLFDPLSPTLCMGSAAYPWNKSLSTETLVSAFRLARFLNLRKSENRTADENALIQMIMGTGRLHTIIKEKKEHSIVEILNQDRELVERCLEQIIV